jgi:hypothetical protein
MRVTPRVETAVKTLGVIGAIAGGLALGSLIFNQDISSKLPKIAGTLVGGLTFAGVLELVRRKQERSSTTAELQAPQLPPAIAPLTTSPTSAVVEVEKPKAGEAPTPANSPICRNCSVEYRGRCGMHHSAPTGGAFECIDFEPKRKTQTEPHSCPYQPPLYPERRLSSELALREVLQQPIRVVLLQKWIGSRDVWIYAPWSDRTDDLAFDICLGETPRWENHEGGIRMACTGHEDYYCNVGAREAAVFAWQVSLAAAIAESQESFERFWTDPQAFIAELPNPNGYKVEVE